MLRQLLPTLVFLALLAAPARGATVHMTVSYSTGPHGSTDTRCGSLGGLPGSVAVDVRAGSGDDTIVAGPARRPSTWTAATARTASTPTR